MCCNFYLQGNCHGQTDYPSTLVANSNFNCGEYEDVCTFFAACECFTLSLIIYIIIINMHSLVHIVCPALTFANGAVSYSAVGSGVERDIGSVATHTCNSGFRLEANNAQGVGNTRTCSSTSGWDGQDFTCGE